MGCHFLLQGLKLCLSQLLHCRQILFTWVTGETRGICHPLLNSFFCILCCPTFFTCLEMMEGLWLLRALLYAHTHLPNTLSHHLQTPPLFLTILMFLSSALISPCSSGFIHPASPWYFQKDHTHLKCTMAHRTLASRVFSQPPHFQ